MILDNKRLLLEKSESRLGFTTTGGSGGAWKVWDRFITLDGEKLFHIGNICGTCAFFFRQLKNDIQGSYAIDELKENLNKGVKSLDIHTLDILSKILPATKPEDKNYCEYDALLLEINPHITRFNDKGDYFKEDQSKLWYDADEETDSIGAAYYRGIDSKITDNEKLYEFYIPLYQPEQLNTERVNYYREKIRKGIKPTAISLSVVDAKTSMIYIDEPADGITGHWCFANYMLDGHHKMYAAALEKKPITLISFLTRDFSWQVTDQLIKHYRTIK